MTVQEAKIYVNTIIGNLKKPGTKMIGALIL